MTELQHTYAENTLFYLNKACDRFEDVFLNNQYSY